MFIPKWSRPVVIDREAEVLLHDRPTCSLEHLEDWQFRLWALMGEADDMGLAATWMRLECAEDHVGRMVAAMKAERGGA